MSQQSSPLELDGYVSAGPADMPAHYALSGKILVGVIVIFFLVIFFVLISHVYAKWFWSGSSNRRRVAFTSTRSTHIHTGLHKTVVAQLPNFIYKAPSSSAEAGDGTRSLECAVCLSEFQENEKGKMLPSCKHTFHTQCIDMWFFSHSTCPLCRASVMPASTAASSGMPSSHEQHEGGEEQVAIEASQNTTEGHHVALSPVQYPCNVHFWGNEVQETSSQDPSSSSSPSSSLPLFTPPTRSLPQIIIDISPTEAISVASTAGSLSSKSTSHTTKQVACSSQTPESPGLCASIKRMLSRQSSRHRSSSQEGSEESPK